MEDLSRHHPELLGVSTTWWEDKVWVVHLPLISIKETLAMDQDVGMGAMGIMVIMEEEAGVEVEVQRGTIMAITDMVMDIITITDRNMIKSEHLNT